MFLHNRHRIDLQAPETSSHSPALGCSSKYRTLCDLPVELLAIIVSYIKHNEQMVGSRCLVCRCLRNVVIEHLFFKTLAAREIESRDHLLYFLQANPNISGKIQTFELSGEALDDSAMLKLMVVLPKLENLELGRFMYPPPPANSISQQDTPGPLTLKAFNLNTLYLRPTPLEYKSFISGFFRILSLFHIEKLTMCHWQGRPCEFDTSTLLNPKFLHQPLRINELHIGPFPRKELDVKCIPFFTNAFTDGIEPGSLQKLVVQPGSPAAVSAIGNLLARVGGELRSLDVGGNGPHPVTW